MLPTPWQRSIIAVVVTCAGGVLPRAVGGQVVMGTVAEARTGHPVVGALVRLELADGRPGPSVLTAGRGEYRLRAPGAGTFGVVVERIGYARTVVRAVRVPAEGSVLVDVAVDEAPVDIEGLSVRGKDRRCSLVEGAAVEIQALWEEARKALAVAEATAHEANLRFRIRGYEAVLDVRSLAVKDEEGRVRNEWGANTVRSLPAADLDKRGYVRAGDDGSMRFYAPDASVLLSPSFLSGHCLEVAGLDAASAGLVGLGFRPVPGRDTTDIRGTIWFTVASARLERIDFSYTGVPDWPGMERAGGSIRFAELPDGRWIVREWFIRAPMVGVVREAGLGGTVDRLMATGLAEQGSRVLRATGRGVEWSIDRPTGRLEGVVYDSLAGAPFRDAEVRLAGRSRRARSGDDGRFSMDGLAPATYRVAFSHPELDALGVEGGWVDVEIRPGETTEVRLAGPSRETLLALGCADAEGAAVVGWVRAAGSDEPIPGASVVVLDLEAGAGGRVQVRADAQGAYRLCGLPARGAVSLVARLGPLASSAVMVDLDTEGYARADLTLDLEGQEATTRGDTEEPPRSIFGAVVDLETGRPLGDVLVELVADDGSVVRHALADSQGRFLLAPPERAEYEVRATMLGYAKVVGAPTRLGEKALQVEIRLAPEAVALAGLVVTVEARVPKLDRNGFYQRQVMGGGQFLVREEIEAMSPVRTTDVALRLPGVRTMRFPGEDTNTTVRRIQLRGALRFTNDQRCLPGIYLDGALIRHPMIPAGEGEGADPFRQLSNYPQLDDLVSPQDIEALEVYDTPAVTPVRFQPPGPPCGVLVIWTRQGVG